ncbi:hypothetical protein [Natronomonas marina]|uniref:hypothetical protein n=1 Tax=Natronomonas marina TaxID=2961939 RepID=UPI0020C9CBD2|nr:hypothetical protein [Natronomonas marina]
MSASGDDGLGIIAFANKRFESPSSAVLASLTGAIVALGAAFIDFWTAVADVIIVPLSAMGELLAGVLQAFIGGGASIIGQGAATTVQSLVPGSIFALGPLTFAEGIAAAGAGILVMTWILSREVTSDTIPFSATDIPFLGVDEDDEDPSE